MIVGNPASCSHAAWKGYTAIDGSTIFSCARCTKSDLRDYDILRSIQDRVEKLEGIPDTNGALLARIEGLESRLDLLQIEKKELLAILKGDPSLFIRTPHLRERVNEMEARMREIPSHVSELSWSTSFWRWLTGKF